MTGKTIEILDILEYYSQCNKYINLDMIKIIKENNFFDKAIIGYFKNIGDILFHILDVDLSWTNDLKQKINSKIFENNLYKNFNENASIINTYKSIIDFEIDRINFDNLLVELIKGMDKEQIEEEITVSNYQTKTVWEILIHTFNHQTHHRGQISQILDENGINNDFSNMIRYDIKKFK